MSSSADNNIEYTGFWVFPETKEKISKTELKKILNNVSFGYDSDLSQFGYFLLEVNNEIPIVAEETDVIVVEGEPEEYEPGKWRQTWEVVPKPLPQVPEQITALQGYLAIESAGFASAFEEWANSPERTFIEKAFLHKAMYWKRSDPVLNNAATNVFGLSQTQLDDLFRHASIL